MKSVLLVIMKIGRKLFRNTPIQRLGLTTFIYKRIAVRAFGTDPVEVDFRGAKILYPGGDYTTLPTLVEGVYEEAELDALEQILDSLDDPIIAVDIGANVGIWTVLLARHPKVAQVLAFEPSNENLFFLQKNIARNHLTEKVEVIQKAVSSHSGNVIFNDSGSGATKRIDLTGSTVVEAVVLDEIVGLRKIGLIKIDVEGHEPSVLNGSWRTLESSEPFLFIEYSDLQTRSAGLSWQSVGTRLVSIYGSFSILDGKESRLEKNFSSLVGDNRLLNLLFVPKEITKPK
jgi:FkbM family methyltransferase